MRSGCPRPSARLTLALGLALAGCFPLSAAAAAPFRRDQTPLPTGVSGTGGTHAAGQAASSGGTAALRMLIGLAIVLAIIFGLYKLLKRSADKNDKGIKAHGAGMTVVASTPLAQSRALHLVQVGQELVLVGSSEQGVTPIRIYGPEEARKLGFDSRTDLPPIVPLQGERPGFGSALVETLRKRTAR
jgi:flagellar biosynthetic protein FliO